MQHPPLCTSVDSDEEDVCGGILELDSPSVEDSLSAFVPKKVTWKGRKELRVKFLSVIPSSWTYAGSGLNTGNILSWASEWSLRGEGFIPSFTLVKDANAPSDIRVLFNRKSVS